MKTTYLADRLLQYNFVISLLLGTLFLWQNDGYKLLDLTTTIVGLISTIGSFYLIFWLFALIFFWLPKFRFYLLCTLFVIFDLFLITDFFIFRLYHTHINAMVLDIALSPAALRNVDLGIYPYIAFAFLVIIFVSLQYMIIRSKNKLISAKSFWIVLIGVIILDKPMFGVANLYSYTEITEKMRVIPYYQPASFNRFAKNYLGIEPAPKAMEMKSAKNARLNYPIAPIKYAESFERENILIIMMDAVRWDMIDHETTPNMQKIKDESLFFDNHISGGNATRFGVFSFFYGLNAPYWFGFLDEQKPAVLFDALDHRGFDTRIYASSDLNWPEFRRTMFAGINDRIVDNLSGSAWQKDRELANQILGFLGTQKEPFFLFAFFDAPHQFSYPATHAKFKPDGDGDKNYLTVNASKRDVLFNQYKNSIYYNDALVGELVAKLKDLGIYDKTKIIITADHGEEFYESGGFGHNHAFSKEQVKPLFFMRLPKVAPKVIEGITSHTDVVPTIMNWLGVANPPSDYALGQNLLDPDYKRDYAVTGNWNYNAFVENGRTLVFSAHPDLVAGTKVHDFISYKRLDPAFSREHSQTILKIMDENRRFYK